MRNSSILLSDGRPVAAGLPGLQVWLDASDLSTHTLSGSNVTQLADKSGFGRHITSATASLPPTVTTATPNGLTALAFTGQQLDHPSTLTFTVGSMFVVWEHPTTTSGTYNGICGFRTGGDIASSMDMQLILPANTPTSRIWGLTSLSWARFIANGQARPGAENEYANASPARTSPDRWNVACLMQTASSGSKRLIMGTDAYASTSRRMQGGKIGEIIVYDRIFTDGEVIRAIRSLAQKWGVRS